MLAVGAAAGAISEASDIVIRTVAPESRGGRSILLDLGVTAVISGATVRARNRRAEKFGLVEPSRRAVKGAGLTATAKATGIGVVSSVALLALATSEQWLAGGVQRLADVGLRRFDVASPLVGHAVALTVLGAAGTTIFSAVKDRVARHGDVIEPAYAKPSLNPHVSSGPRSTVHFDQIGKEGRRFVLMALTGEEIAEVMGASAIDPVRAIGPLEPRRPVAERAAHCIKEMEALGAFDRSLICVASPTGVGYVSYTFAESLEYLTLGNCAIVVPEYAMVPSALALSNTDEGTDLQRELIRLIRRRIDRMPSERRPRLVQFGESLGAQVALDVSYPGGAGEFARVGVDAGLYLGVPFRSRAWNAWQRARLEYDPGRSMVALSQPDRVQTVPEPIRSNLRHFMIIHFDDPVNKFSYRLSVKAPAWMGPPATRPPKVPRETLWRPIITFALTVMDLKNGMDYRPGKFVRRGHDYRIESRAATALAFGLQHTDEQARRVEAALREREQQWATRRLVARKFARARESISQTLRSWGLRPAAALAELSEPALQGADINPADRVVHRHLDSSRSE